MAEELVEEASVQSRATPVLSRARQLRGCYRAEAANRVAGKQAKGCATMRHALEISDQHQLRLRSTGTVRIAQPVLQTLIECEGGHVKGFANCLPAYQLTHSSALALPILHERGRECSRVNPNQRRLQR